MSGLDERKTIPPLVLAVVFLATAFLSPIFLDVLPWSVVSPIQVVIFPLWIYFQFAARK